MNRSLPPYPTGDLREWATQLVDYLQSRERVEEENIARPVALSHKLDAQISRALQDGVVMFDPQLGKLVYSQGGQWVPVANDLPVFDYAAVQPQSVTADYVPISVSPPIGLIPIGVYQVSIVLKVLGTGGNAFFQLAVFEGGNIMIEGEETSVSNGELAYIPVDFFIDRDFDTPVSLQIRGNAVDVQSGTLSIVRIGQ
jgi:hypothetical protein